MQNNTGANFSALRNDAHQEMRTERINSALYFNMSQGDEDIGDDMESLHSLQSSSMGVTQTTESGIQAQVRTTSSGTQSSTTQMDEFGGTQTIRIKTKEKGNQATEDRSGNRTTKTRQ